jgi:hypothetical protein
VLTGSGDATLGALVRLFVNPALGNLVGEGQAFPQGAAGGVNVAAGDVNGDGRDDIVVAAGAGGNANLRVFSVGNGAGLLNSFFAYPGFGGGVNVAVGDVNGDGMADIVTGQASNGGEVRLFGAFPGGNFIEVGRGAPLGPAFVGGVFVATGDLTGDGRAEIIVAAGPGGGPHVRAFDIGPGFAREIASFFAYEPGFQGGVRVGAADVNGDGRAEILTAPGPGRPTTLHAFPVAGNQVGADMFSVQAAFGGFQGGAFIAGW